MRPGDIKQVESRLYWTTSSYSSEEGGECVEVAARSHAVHIRDSKNRSAAGLTVGTDTWAAFLAFAAEQAR